MYENENKWKQMKTIHWFKLSQSYENKSRSTEDSSNLLDNNWVYKVNFV